MVTTLVAMLRRVGPLVEQVIRMHVFTCTACTHSSQGPDRPPVWPLRSRCRCTKPLEARGNLTPAAQEDHASNNLRPCSGCCRSYVAVVTQVSYPVNIQSTTAPTNHQGVQLGKVCDLWTWQPCMKRPAVHEACLAREAMPHMLEVPEAGRLLLVRGTCNVVAPGATAFLRSASRFCCGSHLAWFSVLL